MYTTRPTSDSIRSHTRNAHRAQCGELEKKMNPKQIHHRADFGVQIRLYYLSRITRTPYRRRIRLVRRFIPRIRNTSIIYLSYASRLHRNYWRRPCRCSVRSRPLELMIQMMHVRTQECYNIRSGPLNTRH